MMIHLKTIALAASALLLIGCSDSEGGDGNSNTGSLRVAIFNVGMARGYVDHAEERFAPIVEAINARDDVDVFCLQEMYFDDDIDALLQGVSEVFPESYMNRTRLSDFADGEIMTAACTEQEAAPLVDCAVPLCDDTADLTSCVLDNCGDHFNALSPDCQGCAASNLSLGNVPDIVDACTSGDAAQYIYDGHNGLLLLSKRPIENMATTNFSSFFIAQSVLYGEVSGLGIACTHLTASLREPVYNGNYASYGDENAAQITDLLNFTDMQRGSKPAIIAGDFNTGPAVGATIAASLPENYAKFEEAGWTNVNTASRQPMCTLCPENGLRSETSTPRMIDHIVVKGARFSQVERIFDQPIDIEKPDGTQLNVSLSDHFGLGTTIEWP